MKISIKRQVPISYQFQDLDLDSIRSVDPDTRGPIVGAGWSKGGKKAVPWSKSPNAQSESWCRRGGPMVGAGWSKGGKKKLYLGVKVRTRRVSPGVGGTDPWLEQSGLRVVNKAVPWSKSPNVLSESWCRRGGPMVGAGWSKNKLYLGVKVWTRRVSSGVGGADPWLEQAGLRAGEPDPSFWRGAGGWGGTLGWAGQPAAVPCQVATAQLINQHLLMLKTWQFLSLLLICL